MFDFFDMIAGWLDSIVNWVGSFIDHLLLLLSLLQQLSSLPLVLAGFMPPLIGTAVIATLLIFALKFLLGR